MFIYLFSLFSCINKNNEQIKKVIKYPNQTSEMAQLMRDMTNQLENIQNKIIRNESLENKQLNFALIHQQKTTDPAFIKPHIQPMSEAFNYSVEEFNNKPNKKNYLAIINNCLSCHQLSCPGPIMKIKKLKINLD